MNYLCLQNGIIICLLVGTLFKVSYSVVTTIIIIIIMTTWPWMKGVEEAIADPIEPIDSHDERLSVKALIEEHRVKIDKIKFEIAQEPLFDPTKHDDLWVLRFWLSHKKSKNAIAAAKTTMAFRKKYNLDAEDIRKMTPSDKSKDKRVAEYWKVRCQGDGIVCTIPDKKRGVILFIKFAQMNPQASELLDEDTWDWSFISSSEWTHQWLDYVTRTTGRLTKSVRFVDMTDLRLFKHMDRASTKRDAKIMNEMEDVYPQLLETLYGCWPPSFMHKVWAFIRPIMPKRIIDKIDLITPDTNQGERARLLKHISEKNLPERFGGSNKVDPADW